MNSVWPKGPGRCSGKKERLAVTLRSIAGGVISVALVFNDVTVRRREENELCRVQKRKKAWAMGGGIAHDFNNILVAIL